MPVGQVLILKKPGADHCFPAAFIYSKAGRLTAVLQWKRGSPARLIGS